MRLFTASIATETNTFAPIPTSRANYEDGGYYPPGKHPDAPKLCTAPLAVGRRRARAEGWTLIEGSCFWAEPSGKTGKRAYEEMRDEILGQLKAAMPVDGILFGLHGAMVAEGYDDCEGDIIGRAREIVGPKAIIGVEHDPHCHLTEKRVALSNLLICYKEFPHTDIVDRAEEVVELTLKAIRGEIKPVMSVWDCRMIGSFPTTLQPMRGFVDKIKGMEGKNGVLSISVAHCFPYADVPEVGSKILVVTDNRKEYGDKLAAELGREFWGMRGKTTPPFMAPDEAISAALTEPKGKGGPVVLADPSDNPGGGAPGDSTVILRRLIERGVDNAALCPIWDPIAVGHAFAAGEGGKFNLRFGAKTAPSGGQPIDAEVTVLKCVPSAFQTFAGGTQTMGDAAAIRAHGIDIVLITHRTQALGADMLTNLGIDPRSKNIVVVKSTNHFHAAYAPIARRIIYVDSEGPIPRDHRKVPYTRVKRPIWPLDDNPHGPAFA
ncbi:MAG: M81 family metallopeptidase [Alphaproteobacteria bacterium]|nr:M81 family metallopeptidase [Alphaproteobacteria bacterium]